MQGSCQTRIVPRLCAKSGTGVFSRECDDRWGTMGVRCLWIYSITGKIYLIEIMLIIQLVTTVEPLEDNRRSIEKSRENWSKLTLKREDSLISNWRQLQPEVDCPF